MSAQEVDEIRSTHFAGVDDHQWSMILNQTIDMYESLSPKEQRKYDSKEGFVKLFNFGRTSKPAFQTGQHPLSVRQRSTPSIKGNVPAKALTPQGKLRMSYINSLSNVDYQRNGELLDNWISSNRIDYTA